MSSIVTFISMIALIMGINSPMVKNEINDTTIEEPQIEVVFDSYTDDSGLSHWRGESLNGNKIFVDENDGWYTVTIQNYEEEELVEDTGEWEGKTIHARNYSKSEIWQIQMDIFDDTMMEALLRQC